MDGARQVQIAFPVRGRSDRGCVLPQMRGPSPLLPAWLDFWLQPSRAAWNRGLKSGASPLLLPSQGSTLSQETATEESRHPVRNLLHPQHQRVSHSVHVYIPCHHQAALTSIKLLMLC